MTERATTVCPHCGGSLAVVTGIQAALVRAIQQASDEHGLAATEVMVRCRRSRFVRARYQVFCLLRREGYSYPEIGEVTGYNTATVQYGVKRSSLAAR